TLDSLEAPPSRCRGRADRKRGAPVAARVVAREQLCDGYHQQDVGDINRKLHRNVGADRGQHDVTKHGEKDTETEDLQRMLPAADDQSRNGTTQELAVARYGMRGGYRKGKEADQAQRRQIGFVLDERRELLLQ